MVHDVPSTHENSVEIMKDKLLHQQKGKKREKIIDINYLHNEEEIIIETHAKKKRRQNGGDLYKSSKHLVDFHIPLLSFLQLPFVLNPINAISSSQ